MMNSVNRKEHIIEMTRTEIYYQIRKRTEISKIYLNAFPISVIFRKFRKVK